jgi:NADPH:quinone reductase
MRAITKESFEGGPALREVPTPQVGPNEVLVRVRASSVNPLDGGIAAGMLKDMFEHEFPVTLGRDFAGVVEQVGEGVSSVAVGDEVFGMVPGFSPPIRDGAWAELIAASEQTLTKKPDGVDTATAGAAPLAALTALPVVDALELSQGDTVLVVGATGGVGSIVVQLAKAAGAIVLASGLPEDEEFLRGLGVDEVFPRDGDLVALVRERHPDGVDALVDAPAVPQDPDRELLDRIARLLADGTVRVPIQQTFDLAQAPEALQALQAGHTQGKIALRVA